MFVTFKFVYQNWKTMTADDVAAQVAKGTIRADQYKQITGNDYVASKS